MSARILSSFAVAAWAAIAATPATALTSLSGLLSVQCEPVQAFDAEDEGAQLVAFKLGTIAQPDVLYDATLAGGTNLGSASLSGPTYSVPANWRTMANASDRVFVVVAAEGLAYVASDSLGNSGGDLGIVAQQPVGALGGTAPAVAATPHGFEVSWRPLAELDGEENDDGCALSGDADHGVRHVVGWNVYRLRRAQYPAPTLGDFLEHGFIGHADVTALDLGVADPDGFGCSDLDPSDELRVVNPDGQPDTGDEILHFRDTTRAPGGWERDEAPTAAEEHWYRVQPVVGGSIAYYAGGGVSGSMSVGATVMDLDGDGEDDGVDIGSDGFWEFIDPSGRGLGLTHGGAILSSTSPGSDTPFMPGPDGDGDGIDDAREMALGLNPGVSNVDTDTDGDGVEDLLEDEIGSSPTTGDGDGGGEADGRELFYRRSPLNACDDVVGGVLGDLNDDGVINIADVVLGLRIVVRLDEPTDRQLTLGDITPTELVDDTVSPQVVRRHGLPDDGEGGYLFGRLGHGDGRIDIADVTMNQRQLVLLSVVVD